MKGQIQELVKQNTDYVINCYHQLHAHPELSFQEFKTARFIQDELLQIGIPFRAGIGGNGILAKIEGQNPTQKVIALRADMDALPVFELVDIPSKSLNEGVMHACGHDAHKIGRAHV